MNLDRPDLLAEAQTHFNEPVLIAGSLCRLVGYAEDLDDCYWIIKRLDNKQPERLIWSSCVGGFISLKHLKEQCVVIPNDPTYPGEVWNDYSQIDNLLEMNGATKEKFFITHQQLTPTDII